MDQLEALLAPLNSADPCGADLEYGDPAFAELERVVQGKPEQQIGNTVVPAEDPDWKSVENKAIALLGRTKDLRATVHLVNALLRTRGFAGFADGLGLLRKLIESYWDGLHPRLDPTDGNDPTMRVNILSSLAAPPVLAAVRAQPLVTSRTLGTFTLKEVDAAVAGAAGGSSNGEQQPAVAALDAATMDCDLTALADIVSALKACLAELAGIETAVAARVEATSAPSFSRLTAMVRKGEVFLAAKLAARTPATAATGSNGEGEAHAGGAMGTPVGLAGQINSREDVLKALEKIAAYYKSHEPSSPIPLFMERCKKMVMMSFVDIVKELVPDALSQVEVLKGRSQ